MSKSIVILCDGTGNEVSATISNVLKLYRMLEKSERQRVYYGPGVGTIGLTDAWKQFKQKVRAILGLATAYGLDDDILAAYRFLCEAYQEGDLVWLFGFSRGAYTVRALAGLVETIGLMAPDQLDLAPYGLDAYKRVGEANRGQEGASKKAFAQASHFAQVVGTRRAPIEFVGVWDTVASVIVPGMTPFTLHFLTLPYTAMNPAVKTFRQAIAIDERRRLFRLNVWRSGQNFKPDPFDQTGWRPQDCRQVWFAGVHGDIGGSYPENASGASKYPLRWMVEHALEKGLRIDRDLADHLIDGKDIGRDHTHVYAPPSPGAPLHDSMNWAWAILEYFPKSAAYLEWPQRKVALGWYLPMGEPRSMTGLPDRKSAPIRPIVHHSVALRMREDPTYRPVNLPVEYDLAEEY